jgi:ribosomal protein S18 acetylase RimI-like enzyme
MYGLAAESPDNALHVTDLPWRLSSPSARQPERTCLWEDASGALVAWAVLQFPAWYCLDFEVRADARSAGLESSVLEWARERLDAEAANRDGRLPFYLSAREQDAQRIAIAEQAGFEPTGWGYVRLAQSLGRTIPASELPEGFVMRPLAGGREAAAYVATHRAAFDTPNMTEDWRLATIRDPHYTPELDLVAIAPDGSLAGFCVCWITPSLAALGGQRIAQIEPLGVLPAYQRMGLGRALLLEALRRAKALGASTIEVNAESFNAASRGAYESVGFRTQFELPFFFRVFGER